MKKIALLMITLLCTLCLLTACGGGDSKSTDAPTELPTEAVTESTETAPAAETTAATEATASDLEIAQQMCEQPLEDLIALIGEPESREYAPSCLIDGEDGILHYDGFTVYTLRYENGEEIIQLAE